VQHPGLQLLLLFLFMPWPLIRIYRRVGLNPLWVLLLSGSLLVPFLGILLVLLPLTVKKWPNFPAPLKPPAPIKRPI
jgi:hypothetical protein